MSKFHSRHSLVVLKMRNIFWTCLVFALIENCHSTRERKSQSESCGVSNLLSRGLVKNGDKVVRGQWPWMVALMYKHENDELRFFCGGTLVASTKVVTGLKSFCDKKLLKDFLIAV